MSLQVLFFICTFSSFAFLRGQLFGLCEFSCLCNFNMSISCCVSYLFQTFYFEAFEIKFEL